MIRKHKKFKKPRKLYDSTRIQEENKIISKYGLKNKREIWKAKAKLDLIRNTAKKLIYGNKEEQEKFITKLKKQGFDVSTTVDVLALTEEDLLKRRLQTILVLKKLATTPKGARQIIVHKNILIGDRIVDVPSYIVKVDEEEKISLMIKNKKKNENIKKEEVIENGQDWKRTYSCYAYIYFI